MTSISSSKKSTFPAIFYNIYYSGNIVPKLTPIEDNHFDLKYETFWEEFLFIADHGEIPKVRLTFHKPRFCVLCF